MEDSAAKAALQSDPEAVAAYDRIPLAAASAVFTMDTASEMFTLHSGQVRPAGGGQLVGSGRIWVACEAETDPRAIRMQAQGQGLPLESMLKRYLPKVSQFGAGATAARAVWQTPRKNSLPAGPT